MTFLLKTVNVSAHVLQPLGTYLTHSFNMSLVRRDALNITSPPTFETRRENGLFGEIF